MPTRKGRTYRNPFDLMALAEAAERREHWVTAERLWRATADAYNMGRPGSHPDAWYCLGRAERATLATRAEHDGTPTGDTP